jgi:hypothetical protein
MSEQDVGFMIAEPILLPTKSGKSPGFLVYAEDALLCVLMRMDEPGRNEGRWKVTLGMGPCSGEAPPPLEYLDEALRWIVGRCASSLICEDRIEHIAGQMEQATVALTTCSAR